MRVRSIFIILLLCVPVFVYAQDVDSDLDGLSDTDEKTLYATDPYNADTDGDGYSDGEEIAHGYSPRYGGNKKLIQVDSDKDYLNDAWEIILGTGLMNPDSDGDKYLDGTEVAASYDPLNPKRVQLEKMIKVDLAKQHVEYFFGDKLFGSFPISSGKAGTPTPKGTFAVKAKKPIVNYGGATFSYPNTKWNLRFYTNRVNYYIHGAYWHNNFGHPMSHGCVNVSYENMEPLYWWAQVGTKVIIE